MKKSIVIVFVCILLIGINGFGQLPGTGNGGTTTTYTDVHQNDVEISGQMKMVQLQDPSMTIDEKKYLMIDKNGNVSAGEKGYTGGISNGNGPSIDGTLGNGGFGGSGNPLNNFWSLLGNDNIVSEGHFLGTLNDASLNFRTLDQNRMTILSNGFVGIGTTAPQKALHIVTMHDKNVFIDNSAVENPPKHMTHYGIRLEDKTTTTTTTIDNIGNSSTSVGVNSTRFDLEAYGGNLLIGKPQDPSMRVDKDGKVHFPAHPIYTPIAPSDQKTDNFSMHVMGKAKLWQGLQAEKSCFFKEDIKVVGTIQCQEDSKFNKDLKVIGKLDAGAFYKNGQAVAVWDYNGNTSSDIYYDQGSSRQGHFSPSLSQNRA